VFSESPGPVQWVLGDDRLPRGLWKAIEQMRKGETSEIMIKPKSAFGHPDYQEQLQFPKGWDSGDKKATIMKRRTFYEVHLIDWVVRHDLDGDGILIKTIEEPGTGYERCQEFDDIVIDLKYS
jgi:hypothetical protein